MPPFTLKVFLLDHILYGSSSTMDIVYILPVALLLNPYLYYPSLALAQLVGKVPSKEISNYGDKTVDQFTY